MEEDNKIDWEEVKKEKKEADLREAEIEEVKPVICDECTKRIGKYFPEYYYKIEGFKYCKDCMDKYKAYV